MADWPEWIQLAITALTSAIVASGFFIRSFWNLSLRVEALEIKVGAKSISQQISDDRHDNLYPMLQIRVFAPIDKIEDEVKHQGQNIAILLDRDRVSEGLKEVIATIHQVAQPKI